MTNDECKFRSLIVCIKNGAKNTSKIWTAIREFNIVQDFNNRDIIDYLRGIAFNIAM